jgi:hypothetical protein
MTGNDIGEGTRAHRAGNRRFGLGMLILIALAGAIGVSLHLMRHGSGPGSIPPLGAIAVAIGFTLVIAVGGWWGFRAVDEVEQRYSMIAAMVGFFTQLAAVMAWTVLWIGGVMTAPSAFAILLASALASVIAYAALRIRG